MKRILTIGLLLAMGTAANAALTQLNFGYELVTGSYDGASTFTLTENASTTGDVVVTANPSKFAQFSAGDADIDATFTVSSITGSTAAGTGTLTMTDVDGSTITATVDGTFTNTGIIFFEGALSGVTYTFGDSTFDGTSGSFSTSDFNTAATLGEIVKFEFDGNWFTAGAFSVDTIQVDGSTALPVPGAALLGVLGLTAITSIRRRFAA